MTAVFFLTLSLRLISFSAVVSDVIFKIFSFESFHLESHLQLEKGGWGKKSK